MSYLESPSFALLCLLVISFSYIILSYPATGELILYDFGLQYLLILSFQKVPLSVTTILVGNLLTFFAVVTVLGNLLVITAVCRERQLRTVTNYFILSLTIADLIIGLIVMPFSISLEVTHNVWMFGSEWCDVWHSLDVLASTASILNLSVISLDRYWAITDPIAYPGKMTTARAVTLIGLVWTCSAAISFPAISWWRNVTISPPSPTTCFFTEDSGYLIFSSIISFYFPISIILFAYFRIYRAATDQTRGLITGSKVLMTSTGCKKEALALRVHRGGYHNNLQQHQQHVDGYSSTSRDATVVTYTSCGSSHKSILGGPFNTRSLQQRWTSFALRKKLSQMAKEQKAAKTLGIVVGVFCICWVPFFVTNVCYGLCHEQCVHHSEVLFPVFTWLGYINSGMNPVIYAYSMRDFRRAFLKIVCIGCGCNRRQRPISFRSHTETSITN